MSMKDAKKVKKDSEHEKEDNEKHEKYKNNEKEDMKEETAASETIKAKPTDATSKAASMAKVMTAMSGMSSDECCKWLEQALALIGHEADTVPNDAAAKNAASVAMKGSATDITMPNLSKAMKEDVAELFGSEELSEEFKEKTSTLFEAAVTARVLAEKAVLEEQFEQTLIERVEEITDTLSEKIDMYLSYAAKEWFKENQVATESAIRAELAESFINGIRNVFIEHDVVLPEDRVDIVEALADEVEELRTRLNESINENIEMSKIVESHTKEKAFQQVSEGLALTQVEKLKSLCENVEFEDIESYKKKIEIIKENYIVNANSSRNKPTSFITEEIDQDEQTEKTVYAEPQIANYARAISRTVKK